MGRVRRDTTPAENILWQELRRNKLGVHFSPPPPASRSTSLLGEVGLGLVWDLTPMVTVCPFAKGMGLSPFLSAGEDFFQIGGVEIGGRIQKLPVDK